MDRPRILVLCTLDPMSTSAHYIQALRKVADVTTCGTMLSDTTLEAWWEDEQRHLFKDPNVSYAEKYVPLARLRQGADRPAPMTIRPDDAWDLLLWIDSGNEFLPSMHPLKIPTAALVGDTYRNRGDQWLMCARRFDHVFVQYRKEDMTLFEGRQVHWLPPAAPSYFLEVAALEPPKIYDIGFCGQTRPDFFPDRCRMLGALDEAGFDLHVHSHILHAYALFLAQTRIGFNHSIAQDLNMRVMEVCASGALLLTSHLPASSGINELLAGGSHYVTYQDEEDLVRKAARYLRNPEEREAITRSARRQVAALHTYEHRVRTLLSLTLGVDV